MHKKTSLCFVVIWLAALALPACTAATPASPAAPAAGAATVAPTKLPVATKGAQARICQVTDIGGINDRSFNATVWKGMQQAQQQLGVEVKYLEATEQTEYLKDIQAFIDDDCDLIVTIGFLMGDATQEAAQKNPNQKFVIVDYSYDPPLPNVLGMVFATDQAAFLAGYLAAGVSKSQKVGTFGGLQSPPVTVFMDGFVLGVHQYNSVHNSKVEALGWNPKTQKGLFTGDFTNVDKGKLDTEDLLQEGVDIIMPVAGRAGLGAGSAAKQDGGAYIIGVDTDWTVSAPDYQDITLTSVLKKMDVAIYLTIQALLEGKFQGGTFTGNLANEGVGLAPYHHLDSLVSTGLRQELEQIKADIVAGKISTMP